MLCTHSHNCSVAKPTPTLFGKPVTTSTHTSLSLAGLTQSRSVTSLAFLMLTPASQSLPNPILVLLKGFNGVSCSNAHVTQESSRTQFSYKWSHILSFDDSHSLICKFSLIPCLLFATLCAKLKQWILSLSLLKIIIVIYNSSGVMARVTLKFPLEATQHNIYTYASLPINNIEAVSHWKVMPDDHLFCTREARPMG